MVTQYSNILLKYIFTFYNAKPEPTYSENNITFKKKTYNKLRKNIN